jgi:hypothetical protein
MKTEACHNNIQEAEVGRSVVSGVPELHGVFKDSWSHKARSFLKK